MSHRISLKVSAYIAVCWLLFSQVACQALPEKLADSDRQALERLLQLLDARLALAPLVAAAKWNAGTTDVEAPERERQSLAAIARQASQLGLDVGFAKAFFQAQFAANKQLQRQLLTQWQQQRRGQFANIPDLGRELRPQFDRYNSALLTALAACHTLLARPQAQVYLRQQVAGAGALDITASARSMALEPLWVP